jgi:nucleotide-binding universal stress UspA family protein
MTGPPEAVQTVVVGVDGSEGSKRALRWALEEARLRRAELKVIRAWLYPQIGAYGAVPAELAYVDVLRSDVQEMLDVLVDEVAGENPGVAIVRVVAEGPPAQVLIEAAADADLLVVGSRGRGGFAGLLLGSVGQQCAHHASCPVVIVRDAGATQ